jgi:hypothetical protein
LNKSTKIWLNYVLGGTICILLLWGIYVQVNGQLKAVDIRTALQTGPVYLLIFALLLMPVNLGMEVWKWKILAGSAQPLTTGQALRSYLAGIAFSIVTPNRIGEYPARILYLKRKNTLRLAGVAVLGAVAQMLTLFIYGFAGLIYYNIYFPGPLELLVLISCGIITIMIAFIYWRFEAWIPIIERIKWLRERRYNVYGKLLKRFTAKEQLTILLISITRYSIYTAQYLILLHWMNVNMPPLQGFLMCALFFWAIAVIPSFTIIELPERGQIGLYLFGHFAANSEIGILVATVAVWCINLIIPGILGSILLVRRRLLR